MTPVKVMQKWRATPKKQRNGRLARKMAKLCGMRSMAEVEVATKLKKYEYEAEKWSYQHEPQKYCPDFRIGGVYIEVKGKMTNETRKKLLSVKRCNPDKKLVLLFLKGNNKIRKGSKTSYMEWGKKNGFVCYDFKDIDKLIKKEKINENI